MTVIKDKLTEAIEAKKNDVNSFVWKLARNSDGVQEEIRLMDATPEQLKAFYKHCDSMLNSTDRNNPGRYTLLDIINEQRINCNVELFLRKLESGSLSADGKGYPRFQYLQDLISFIRKNRDQYPEETLENTPITYCTNGISREFESVTIAKVRDACLDKLGWFQNKHITFSFIIGLGIYLTPAEIKEFREVDANGKPRKVMDVIRERLNLNPKDNSKDNPKDKVWLFIDPAGLNFTELRAMLTLRPKKYSELTTDQLVTLRNKVLFRLEEQVAKHIKQWEEIKSQIEKVANVRQINLAD